MILVVTGFLLADPELGTVLIFCSLIASAAAVATAVPVLMSKTMPDRLKLTVAVTAILAVVSSNVVLTAAYLLDWSGFFTDI